MSDVVRWGAVLVAFAVLWVVDESRRNWKRRAERAEHDIHAYRGALGHAVPGSHDGRLTDGTTPRCGLCDARAKYPEWFKREPA